MTTALPPTILPYTSSLIDYQCALNDAAADLGLQEGVAAAAAHLEEHGYAIVPGVLTAEFCDTLHAEWWRGLTVASGGRLQRPEGPQGLKKMKLSRDWLANRHGILEDGALAHLPLVHAVRTHPRVVSVFAALYGAERGLVFATDRLNYQLPPEWLPRQVGFQERWIADPDDIRHVSEGSWLHHDQAFAKPGRHCIQGLVLLEDATQPGDASLEVVAGSHRAHATLEDTLGLQLTQAQRRADWYKLSDADKARLDARGDFAQLKVVRAPKGAMILWDSRTLHQGGRIRAHPTKLPRAHPRARFVVYTCYQPVLSAEGLTVQQVAKKRQVFEKLRATAHWPLKTKAFGPPRTYGREDLPVFDWSTLVVRPLATPGRYPVLEELAGLTAQRTLRYARAHDGPLLAFDPSSGVCVGAAIPAHKRKNEGTPADEETAKRVRLD